MIKDSGERREFSSGAVRDIQEGKGACWMLPLKEVSAFMKTSHLSAEYYDVTLKCIYDFLETGNDSELYHALSAFCILNNWDLMTMLLELSVHFEEGARKYNPFNWTLGIEAHCFLDSAIRHYLKFCRGDQDESHARAFCWNIFCLLWTIHNRPECNDLADIKTVIREDQDKDEH